MDHHRVVIACELIANTTAFIYRRKLAQRFKGLLWRGTCDAFGEYELVANATQTQPMMRCCVPSLEEYHHVYDHDHTT